MDKRQITHRLIARLAEPRRFIQIVVGPRQVGKTTAARQALQEAGIPSLMVSGDDSSTKGGTAWIETQWERARQTAKSQPSGSLLVNP